MRDKAFFPFLVLVAVVANFVCIHATTEPEECPDSEMFLDLNPTEQTPGNGSEWELCMKNTKRMPCFAPCMIRQEAAARPNWYEEVQKLGWSAWDLLDAEGLPIEVGYVYGVESPKYRFGYGCKAAEPNRCSPPDVTNTMVHGTMTWYPSDAECNRWFTIAPNTKVVIQCSKFDTTSHYEKAACMIDGDCEKTDGSCDTDCGHCGRTFNYCSDESKGSAPGCGKTCAGKTPGGSYSDRLLVEIVGLDCLESGQNCVGPAGMGDFKYFCNTDLNNGETITIPAAPEAKRLYFNFKSDPLDKDMDMANKWQEEWGPPPVVGFSCKIAGKSEDEA